MMQERKPSNQINLAEINNDNIGNIEVGIQNDNVNNSV